MTSEGTRVLSEDEARKIDVQTQYNAIAEAYARAQQRAVRIHGDSAREFLRHSIGDISRKVILDLGCGHGEDLAFYQTQNPARVLGVDPSEEMIRLARHRVSNPVDVLLGSAELIPFPNNFVDIVTSRFALNYAPDLDKGWNQIARVMKPGGTLAYVSPHPMSYFRMKGDKDYEKQALVRLELFEERVPIFHHSHTFTDYFSPTFFKNFVVEDFMEGNDIANQITAQLHVPGTIGIKARRR